MPPGYLDLAQRVYYAALRFASDAPVMASALQLSPTLKFHDSYAAGSRLVCFNRSHSVGVIVFSWCNFTTLSCAVIAIKSEYKYIAIYSVHSLLPFHYIYYIQTW